MKVLAPILLCASAIAMAIFPSHAADTSEAYDWTSIPVGGGGNIPCLVIHPKVKDVMYIGADVGAVDRWHARIGASKMLSHRFIADDVEETVFANGLAIWVNFSAQERRVEGESIPALGCRILEA